MAKDENQVSKLLEILAMVIAVGILLYTLIYGGIVGFLVFLNFGTIAPLLYFWIYIFILDLAAILIMRIYPLISAILFIISYVLGVISIYNQFLTDFIYPFALVHLICAGLVLAVWRQKKKRNMLSNETW